jgi:tetratricopeptide (TPR) repeat protein
MKRLLWIVLGAGLGIAVSYFNRSKPPAVPAETVPAAESAPAASRPEPGPARAVAIAPDEPAPVVAATTASPAPIAEAKPPDPGSAAVVRIVDALVSGGTDFKEKQALWRQLRSAGQLDQAIAELKQRVAANPNAAENALALSEAYFTKIPSVTTQNERGLLALQADQSLDDALALAPGNWEAQFMKATSLSYWPEGLGKGEEIIQRFTALINQQESMPPRPEFAASYLLLGSQYQKAGNPDLARAVWQAGAELFPNNPELTAKLAR